MTNLDLEVEKYLKDDRHLLEDMRSYFASLTLENAVDEASKGLNPNSTINSHQHRVGRKRGEAAAIEMSKFILELRTCKSFEDIFQITERVKNDVFRLGDLWSYDTALRIGFALNFLPTMVYVQRGVVKGVEKALNEKMPRARFISLTSLPKEIQRLKPYQAENFLCIWGRGKTSKIC